MFTVPPRTARDLFTELSDASIDALLQAETVARIA